jgi:hypothetical protein
MVGFQNASCRRSQIWGPQRFYRCGKPCTLIKGIQPMDSFGKLTSRRSIAQALVPVLSEALVY